MSTLLADFRARFVADDVNDGEPVPGRIVMNRNQLVLAGGGERINVPLDAVFDLAVGHVPAGVSEFFDDSVTVAWMDDDRRHVAIVEAGREAVDRFASVLFKAHLNGTTVAVVHPARLGGRVIDTPVTAATVVLEPEGVAFRGERPFTVIVSTVTAFAWEERTIAGRKRPTLVVTHHEDDTDVESLVHVPDSRKFNVLGRYLRREHRQVVADLEDVTVSEEGLQILVGLHAASGLADPGNLLDDPGQADAVLARLREKGLLVDGEGATEITSRGRVLVNRRLEEVNN